MEGQEEERRRKALRGGEGFLLQSLDRKAAQRAQQLGLVLCIRSRSEGRSGGW